MMVDPLLPTSREAIRQRVWADLRHVARPDSRFHWDFAEFITDYEGSEAGADRIQPDCELFRCVTPFRAAQSQCHYPVIDGLYRNRGRILGPATALCLVWDTTRDIKDPAHLNAKIAVCPFASDIQSMKIGIVHYPQ